MATSVVVSAPVLFGAHSSKLGESPVWDAAQVSWNTNGFQVIMQTVFAVALGVGCLVSSRAAECRD